MASLDPFHIEPDRWNRAGKVNNMLASKTRLRYILMLGSLNGELSALRKRGISSHSDENSDTTYRQHPQKRSLPSILQADHSDVHLSCPMIKSNG